MRSFTSTELKINTWGDIKPYFENLLERTLNSPEQYHQWLRDRSELESVISEDMAWRYVRMSCDTANEEKVNAYNYFVSEIEPQISPLSNELDEKALASPFRKELKGQAFEIMFRSMDKNTQIFREANVPLFAELTQESQKYGATVGAMTVEMDGQEVTLQKASDKLQSTNRTEREETYFKINQRRLQDSGSLNELYHNLILKRHQVAQNADFANFRDYMFSAMGRFDYTKEDCFAFHEAVQNEIVPLLNILANDRKEKLKLDELRPWDLSVDKSGKAPLKPFDSAAELLEKTITCFDKLDTFLGDCLREMQKLNRFDLESRKGKAPGGYNYPMEETGYPFIFMNATSNFRDMITLLHEGGHAVHSVLTKDLELNSFRGFTSEVAELASMSMELITMDHWDLFFPNPDDLKRAKRQHLESILETLPWVATIDKFQHWVYENPTHTTEERTAEWNKLHSAFSSNVIDWSDLQSFKDNIWQKQLHLYEVPFYYIEYGIAQLGAVAVWKNYKENPKEGLKQYLAALSLGYTKPIKEIYATAGIRFDFSHIYISELMAFVKEELDLLK